MNLDITFPQTPCSILSLDIVDVTGVHVVNIGGRLHKNVLDRTGKIIRTYDALAESAHNQELVYQATIEGLDAKEGC